MTWGEFKEAVEAQGVSDNDIMSYIDIRGGDLVAVRRFPERNNPSRSGFMVIGRTPPDDE